MARFSKSDVLALQLADDLKKLDLSDDRAVLAWITTHCVKRADPRLAALRAGGLPISIKPNRRKAPESPKRTRRKHGKR